MATKDIAVRAAGLGKRYQLGERSPQGRFTEAFAHALRRMAGGVTDRPGHRDRDMLWALEDVSFEVERGEIFGIIGRNGAGKSTLLKILARITEPTRGEALVRGRVGTLLEVGTGFHPELTGRENIFLNGAILGMKNREIASRLDEIVAFAEVERFLDTPVKHYSSGMFLRLGFAVAAHLEPEILIVDEVLAVGDIAFQRKCLGKMEDVGREGRTVLLVSHNLSLIANLCQRVLLIRDGRVGDLGDASEVVGAYLSAGASTAGEVSWPSPSEDDAPGCLVAARILQDGLEGPTADVDITKDVRIEIDFRNFRAGNRLYAAIWLKDSMGTAVLSSGTRPGVPLEDDPWFERPLEPGLYRSTVIIPGNFLNDSTYRITPILGTPPMQAVQMEEDALSLQVHDSGEMRRGGYYGSWLGVVRPRLAWHTQPVDATS